MEMDVVVEKTTVETPAAAPCCESKFLRETMREAAGRIERGFGESREAIAEKLENGKEAAERVLRRGRYAMEDSLENPAHKIRRHPFGAVMVAFAAGAAMGMLIPRGAPRKG